MPTLYERATEQALNAGDQVELVEADQRHGLRRGARGRVVAVLRYWNRVKVDFGRGREVAVGREKLRRLA